MRKRTFSCRRPSWWQGPLRDRWLAKGGYRCSCRTTRICILPPGWRNTATSRTTPRTAPLQKECNSRCFNLLRNRPYHIPGQSIWTARWLFFLTISFLLFWTFSMNKQSRTRPEGSHDPSDIAVLCLCMSTFVGKKQKWINLDAYM